MSDAHPPPSLRQTAVAGVKWTSIAAAVGFVTTMLQPLILVRLLEPRDFGLMAALLVVVGFAQSFADMGISSAVQVRKEVTPEALSSLFWANGAMRLLLFASLFFGAPLIADFYNEPELTSLSRWAALVFVITPLAIIPRALLQRALRFDVGAKADMAGGIAALFVSVAAAVAGAAALSLVWGWLAGATVRSLIVAAATRKEWRPTLRFKRRDLDGYLSFGLYQMGERTINYFGSNVDYLLIGRFLGAEALGIYSVAYQLIVRPLRQINPILTRVALPVFAKRQDDDAALQRGFIELTRLLGFLIMPLLIGLAVVADAFVPVVLGDRWLASVPLIEILAVVGLLKALTNPVGAIFLAKNRPDIGFKLNLFGVVALAAMIAAVVNQGVEAVAWATLAFGALTALVLTPWLMHLVIGLRPVDYAAGLRTPAAIVGVMAAVTALVHGGLGALTDDPAVVLAGSVAAGATLYCALLYRFEREYLGELWRLFRGDRAARGVSKAAAAAQRREVQPDVTTPV